jgi:2,4-dienoyl-CoA reductase-like NADH-dependent reductase (Old Yellow Enzyme family)
MSDGMGMPAAGETAAQIEKLQRRLDALDRERAGIVAQLEHVKRLQPTDRDYTEQSKTASPTAVAAVTMARPLQEAQDQVR